MISAPYFYDQRAATLDAVRVMGRQHLGRDLPDDDVRVIASFLRSLTDALSEKRRLIEEFTPDNAVLRNSTTYFAQSCSA